VNVDFDASDAFPLVAEDGVVEAEVELAAVEDPEDADVEDPDADVEDAEVELAAVEDPEDADVEDPDADVEGAEVDADVGVVVGTGVVVAGVVYASFELTHPPPVLF